MILNVKSHADHMAQAIAAGDPILIARCTKDVVETARQLVGNGQWFEIEEISTAVDTVLATARANGNLPTNKLKLLADLTQQTLAVLQFLAHTHGDRRTGQFIAARTQAKRLDKMTNNRLQLVSLVELLITPDGADNPYTRLSLL